MAICRTRPKRADYGGGGGGDVCSELAAFRQFHSHFTILAFRSTMDGNCCSDEPPPPPPPPGFPAQAAAVPLQNPPPLQGSSALLLVPLPPPPPPLTEPTELPESSSHTSAASVQSFFTIDLQPEKITNGRHQSIGKREGTRKHTHGFFICKFIFIYKTYMPCVHAMAIRWLYRIKNLIFFITEQIITLTIHFYRI